MSYVTSMVVVCVGMDIETDAIEAMNRWCREHDPARGQEFAKLDGDAAGGNKFMGIGVWAMGGNHFPSEDLVDEFPKFGWKYPGAAVLYVLSEQSDVATVCRAATEEEVAKLEATIPW